MRGNNEPRKVLIFPFKHRFHVLSRFAKGFCGNLLLSEPDQGLLTFQIYKLMVPSRTSNSPFRPASPVISMFSVGIFEWNTTNNRGQVEGMNSGLKKQVQAGRGGHRRLFITGFRDDEKGTERETPASVTRGLSSQSCGYFEKWERLGKGEASMGLFPHLKWEHLRSTAKGKHMLILKRNRTRVMTGCLNVEWLYRHPAGKWRYCTLRAIKGTELKLVCRPNQKHSDSLLLKWVNIWY